MVTVTAPHLHMGWVRAIRNTVLCSRMQSTGTGGSNPVSPDHEKLVLEPFGHSASHCSSGQRRGCLFHIFTPKFLPDNPAGISWLSGENFYFYFKICHTRPQKIKGLFALLAWKSRGLVGQSFILFFLKSGHRRNAVSFMCVHSWARRALELVLVLDWVIFHYIWLKCLFVTVLYIFWHRILTLKKKKKKKDPYFPIFWVGRKMANKPFLGPISDSISILPGLAWVRWDGN